MTTAVALCGKHKGFETSRGKASIRYLQILIELYLSDVLGWHSGGALYPEAPGSALRFCARNGNVQDSCTNSHMFLPSNANQITVVSGERVGPRVCTK